MDMAALVVTGVVSMGGVVSTAAAVSTADGDSLADEDSAVTAGGIAKFQFVLQFGHPVIFTGWPFV